MLPPNLEATATLIITLVIVVLEVAGALTYQESSYYGIYLFLRWFCNYVMSYNISIVFLSHCGHSYFPSSLPVCAVTRHMVVYQSSLCHVSPKYR